MTGGVDLTNYLMLAASVAKYANRRFGFERNRVLALEIDGSGDPEAMCRFEVGSVEYRVKDGRISVHWQPGDVPPDEDD